MSFWDYVPVVATIKHLTSDAKGRDIADYEDCKIASSICESGDPPSIHAAKLECERCIVGKLSGYINDYCGAGVVTAVFSGTISAVITAIVGAITKKLIAQSAAKSAIATSGGITILLAVDGVADLAITLKRLNEMEKAAQAAKDQFCQCG